MICLENEKETPRSRRQDCDEHHEYFSVGCLRFWTLALLALSVLPAACDGSKNESKESALVEFLYSDCKDGIEEDNAIPDFIALYTMSDSTDLEGLECVSWKHDGKDALSVDLINFTNGCLPSWNGEAAIADDGTVELVVENPGCGMGACGSCIYDWSFEVEGVSATQDAEVAVSVWSYQRENCDMWDPADSLSSYALTISKAELSSGMVCRYVNPSTLEWLSKTAGAFLPCGEEQTCTGDLECVSHPDSNRYAESSLCLPVCTEASECPDPTLMTCDEGGHCVLSEIWNG